MYTQVERSIFYLFILSRYYVFLKYIISNAKYIYYRVNDAYGILLRTEMKTSGKW